ncbi:hypothetical protein JHW43_003566 [Diplocarpon mali]|nr:hypothetical protein JHW43_003566 [Diplocarpon mali]
MDADTSPSHHPTPSPITGEPSGHCISGSASTEATKIRADAALATVAGTSAVADSSRLSFSQPDQGGGVGVGLDAEQTDRSPALQGRSWILTALILYRAAVLPPSHRCQRFYACLIAGNVHRHSSHC